MCPDRNHVSGWRTPYGHRQLYELRLSARTNRGTTIHGRLNRRIVAYLAVLGGCALALAALTGGQRPAVAQTSAPDLFIMNIRGAIFDAQQAKGPYVVSFFFVGCVPCEREIPRLYRLLKSKYPKVGLLFIDPFAEDQPKLPDYARRLRVPESYFYPDPLNQHADDFGVKQRFPTIVGVSGDRILFREHGLDDSNIGIIETQLRSAQAVAR